MRLLVTGADGMLAHDVMRTAELAGHEVLGTNRAELDIAEPGSIEEVLERVAPEAVINCAAWTDVDGAETHPEKAHAINAAGAGNLARAAADAGLRLVHVSTDYAFDGTARVDAHGAPRAYVESDPTAPHTVYGQTKLAGEQLVLGASPRHTVARTSWLFGTAGSNFVATMLRLADERGEVRVVSDQTGSPTWAGHLAPALIGLLEREVSGLVHLAGGGHVSWHDFAREIFRQAEVECRLGAGTSAEIDRPAPRPAWSALESERQDVLPLPPWQDGLAGYLAARVGLTRMGKS
ncbi:MAG: dTDP-4-dehydrorhamnose reductase [Solirubrobacterales bacterium]|nr:dTDP-4-dehydrorhamnose reductase [Solirubrobacterales bacterium]